MELIYENESVKFYFDSEKQIFRANFYGSVIMDNITEAFNFIISNPKDLNTLAILSDLTNLKGTFTMLMDYFEDKLYPYLNSKGILCDAIVLNNDAFTKFAVNKLKSSIDYIKIKQFTDETDAMNWINSIIEKSK